MPRRFFSPARPLADVPQELVQRLAPTADEAARRVRELVAIELFREGKMSGTKVAEILGISRQELMALLRSRGVPYLDLSEDELRRDVENARSHSERTLLGNRSSPTAAA